jgi:exonuclease SbcC
VTDLRLKSISIQNFRSIEGEIKVPLDAPVVLIHGQNGAGKTSMLSAIELALTGAIPSLGRAEPDYLQYLPHKKAKDGKGKIELEVAGLTPKDRTSVTVTKAAVEKTHLLDQNAARFFSERCYLAQSTLTRLLELYEGVDTRRSESQLTTFVRELLGLDQFDAIIEGLRPVGDVRRLRGEAPAFWSAREDIPELEQEIGNDREEEETLNAGRILAHDRLATRIASIFGQAFPEPFSLEVIEAQLRASDDEGDLLVLARARRDIIAILEQWRALSAGTPGVDREAVEAEDNEARAALDAWKKGPGKALDAVIEELRTWMPQLATSDSAGPERAGKAALEAVTMELTRIDALITRDEADAKLQSDAERVIVRGRARLPSLDEEISKAAGANEALAQALSELQPHVHDDDCPVCGRDFSEVSPTSLAAHLSARIADMVEAAGRLQSLTADKAATQGAIVAAERNVGAIQGRRLPADQLDDLKLKRARFEELKPQLDTLQNPAAQGAALAGRVARAARQLANLRTSDQAATVLRQSVNKLASELNQAELGGAEALDAGAGRLRAHVQEREVTLAVRAGNRRTAMEDLEELKRLDLRLAQVQKRIETSERRLAELTVRKREADRRIELAKDLARQTREQRTAIVRRVFNDELNSVWSDLFVRLAPEELFVPAFALPETSAGPVEAVLETRYRLGGKGGNPRAMLSAGNLNTAALTLFLALHLSAKRRLPWLIIDDPVQSMDEVHISQFAALLRTLSKQMNRQVIIAVHERPLFDYLALELSPAFPEDRLITIELSRAANEKTIARWDAKTYEPDRAIAIAA